MIATLPALRPGTPLVPTTFTRAPPDPSLTFGALGTLLSRAFRHVPAIQHPQDERSPTHARTQPAPIPAARRRHRRVHRAVEQHRARRRDSRRTTAPAPIEDVEHIVVLMQENRSFDHYFGTLRGRPRLRRPAAGDACPAASRCGTSPTARKDDPAVPARRPTTSGMQFLQGLAARLGRRPRRRSTAASTTSGCRPRRATTMAYLTREDIPFHYALADAFTLCDAYHCSFIGSTDPNRYYMWTGLHRQRRHGRRPGPRQRRGRLRLDHVPRAAGEGRGLLEDLPGHRRRPGRGRLLGLDRATPTAATTATTRCCTSTSTATPSPATRCTTRPAPAPNAKAGDGYFDQLTRRRQGRQAAAGLLDRRARGLHRALQLARELRRLVHRAGPGRAHLQPRGVEQDRAVHHLRRERRLLRPRRAAVRRRPPPRRACPPSTSRSTSSRATRGHVAGPYGLGPRVPMLVVSPWSKGGYVCSEIFDHTSIIRFMERRFGVQRAEHLALAARRLRRPDLRLRLRPHGHRAGRAARHRRLRAAGPRPPPRLRADPARRRHAAQAGARLRPARPLQYAPSWTARPTPATGKFTLTFAGGATAGAAVPGHLRQPHRRPVDLHHRGRQVALGHLELGVLERRRTT